MRRLLCGLIVLLSMGACTRRQPAPLRVQYLEIWAEQLNKTTEEVIQSWSAQSGVPVTITRVPLSALRQRVAEFVEVPGAADVVVLPATEAVIHRGVLADLSGIVTDVGSQGHAPLAIAAAMNRGDTGWAAVPLYSWSHIFVWRRDWLAAKNLTPPRTFAEAIPTFRALTDRATGRYGFGIGLGSDDDSKMFVQSLIWSFGGSVFDRDGAVTLRSPAVATALQYLLTLHREGVLPPGVMGWDGASNNRAFLAGTIAATANSPTILYAAVRQQPQLGESIVHTLYPEGPSGRHTFATGFSLAVRRDNPRLEVCADLIRYVVRPDNYSKQIVAADGSVNPQYAGYDSLPLWRNANLQVGLASMAFEHPVGWPGPVSRAAAEVFERHVVNDVLARVINDGKTLDEAIAEAQTRAEEIARQFPRR